LLIGRTVKIKGGNIGRRILVTECCRISLGRESYDFFSVEEIKVVAKGKASAFPVLCLSYFGRLARAVRRGEIDRIACVYDKAFFLFIGLIEIDTVYLFVKRKKFARFIKSYDKYPFSSPTL
jgi:hypothetical protein